MGNTTRLQSHFTVILFQTLPMVQYRTDLTKFLGPKQHHVPIQLTDSIRIRRSKSWLQPSTGHPCSTLYLYQAENPSPSLRKRAANTLPLNHRMATWGLRIMYQPFHFPRAVKCHAVVEICRQPHSHQRSYAWFALTQLRKPVLFNRLLFCTSYFHLCAQSPASLQAIPRTNRLVSIFSSSHCHCLDLCQGNIFLMFFPNPKRREKKKDIILYVICLSWCARSSINKRQLHSVPNTLLKALPSWPVQSAVPE